jgi:dTDP-4-amino-4,6-dideoxygalactose transaminase
MIAALQGGIVVCRDAKTLEQVRLLNEYDSVMDRWRLADEEKLRGTYHIGFNFRMSALQAALANSQLRRLPQFIARRKEIASYYTRHFERLGMACPEVPPDESNVFFRYMVEVSTAVPTVLARLLQKGIQAGRGVYPPLHLLLGLPDEKFPEASRAMRKLISVPVHPSLSDREVEMIAEAVGQDSR